MGAELKTARKPKIRERAGEEKEKAEKSFKNQYWADHGDEVRGRSQEEKTRGMHKFLITGYQKNGERIKAESQGQLARKLRVAALSKPIFAIKI